MGRSEALNMLKRMEPGIFSLQSMMINWKYIKFLTSIFVFGLSLVGCIQSDYTKLVKTELAKGVRHDSILLGINLGDSQKMFRDKCLTLNKNHLTMEGPAFYVQYLFDDSLSREHSTLIRLLFKPEFDE